MSCGGVDLRRTRVLRAGVLHRHLRPRHLLAEFADGVPFPSSGPRDGGWSLASRQWIR
ncbi:hypothetical protein Goarm_021112 [Gossypium armourianum]|uniref:Uncharacterized protein n=1 Tax=Gossypium armourianum TaxID=34283 RepID=A0A7J9IQL2_9ROSI|nr:hypothetical protein [Gossypium armourianum]